MKRQYFLIWTGFLWTASPYTLQVTGGYWNTVGSGEGEGLGKIRRHINPNRFKMFIDAYGFNHTVEEMDRVREDIMKQLVDESGLKAISGIEALLKDLKLNHFQIALASSSSYVFIDSILDKIGIRDYFDYILSGEDLANSKPAPDIFLEAAKGLGCLPHQCIVIEDSNNGVAAAKAAGMKCIGYMNRTSGNQDLTKATVVIDDFNRINAQFIEKLI